MSTSCLSPTAIPSYRVPTTTCSQPTNDAMVAAGVVVVESAGDSGSSGTVEAPADDPNVIDAAGSNDLRLLAQADGYTNGWLDDNMTTLSSGGTTPLGDVVDLVAPGYLALAAAGAGQTPLPLPTEAFGGTSQSAPFISGAAADVIQAYRAHPRRCHSDAGPGEGDPHQHGNRHGGRCRPAGRGPAEHLRGRRGGPQYAGQLGEQRQHSSRVGGQPHPARRRGHGRLHGPQGADAVQRLLQDRKGQRQLPGASKRDELRRARHRERQRPGAPVPGPGGDRGGTDHLQCAEAGPTCSMPTCAGRIRPTTTTTSCHSS